MTRLAKSDRPTIEDVANKAGVSMMTVSRALNNSAPVGPETRERVLQAVRELGYVSNQAARHLAMRQRMRNVAFLLDESNVTVLGRIEKTRVAQTISRRAELVFVKLNPDRSTARICRTLMNLGIEGVVLAPPLCDDLLLRRTLSGAGIRIVSVGHEMRKGARA